MISWVVTFSNLFKKKNTVQVTRKDPWVVRCSGITCLDRQGGHSESPPGCSRNQFPISLPHPHTCDL